jgi:hypothetical protein
MADLHPVLERIGEAGNKGAFEQESLGPATAEALMRGILDNPPIHPPG